MIPRKVVRAITLECFHDATPLEINHMSDNTLVIVAGTGDTAVEVGLTREDRAKLLAFLMETSD